MGRIEIGGQRQPELRGVQNGEFLEPLTAAGDGAGRSVSGASFLFPFGHRRGISRETDGKSTRMAEEADFVTLIEDERRDRRRPCRAGRSRSSTTIQGVHTGTRFALQDFTLHGRGLELLSARSAAEARELFRSHPDMAVILLDVVMETEGAGLELVAVRPHGAEERDGPHHPAHRPARPGAGAPRRRRLRHQRLQGEDRADRRQALHRADGGAAQLRAAPEAGARRGAGWRSSSTRRRRCSTSARCSASPKAC